MWQYLEMRPLKKLLVLKEGWGPDPIQLVQFSPYKRDTRKLTLFLHTKERLCEYTVKRQLSTNEEESPHWKPADHPGTLISDFQTPEL